jgi:hypothetical protein
MGTRNINHLFDLRGANIKATCWCGRVSVLDGRKLLDIFRQRGWNTAIEAVGGHLRCKGCRRHPDRIEITGEPPSG